MNYKMSTNSLFTVKIERDYKNPEKIEIYGPTNEKLAAYIYDVFSQDGENAALRWHRGETQFAPQ